MALRLEPFEYQILVLGFDMSYRDHTKRLRQSQIHHRSMGQPETLQLPEHQSW